MKRVLAHLLLSPVYFVLGAAIVVLLPCAKLLLLIAMFLVDWAMKILEAK
tara:strand:+ start:630 stop:779 length:150 start_codon:yes stop_codon:yes gene_type:complete